MLHDSRFAAAAVLLWTLSSLGCVREVPQKEPLLRGLVTPQIQQDLRTAIPSIVGVGGVFDYDTEIFGMKDSVAHTIMETNGGGVVIYRDDRRSVILTCAHLLDAPDTTITYYRDSAGHPTAVPFSRSIKTQSTFRAIDNGDRSKAATVLRINSRYDLGLIMVTSTPPPGTPTRCPIAYGREADWGDVAFAVGYPRGIKQVTLGIVSHSPYPGTFAVDVVARAGYSGGPVLIAGADGTLELAGILRAVPASPLEYVAPPPTMVAGEPMTSSTLEKSTAEEYDMIDYGTVYAVGTARIGQFLSESVERLKREGISLPVHLLPP